jgi:hypothetical protein
MRDVDREFWREVQKNCEVDEEENGILAVGLLMR